jgi:predicted protein tyrosine phosphatase
MRNNALWNCKNPYQGDFKHVLCVCSAGLLRSPTIAYILSMHGYNTRAAGVHDYALIQVDPVLIEWADIIICADSEHEMRMRDEHQCKKEIITLHIPDNYMYRDPKLIAIIEEALFRIGLIEKTIE